MYFIYHVNISAMWEIYDAYIKPSLKALLSVWQQPNGEWSVSFFNQRQKILLMMLYTNRISDANERSKAFFICNVCFLLYAEIDRWNVWTDDVSEFLSNKNWGNSSYMIYRLFTSAAFTWNGVNILVLVG